MSRLPAGQHHFQFVVIADTHVNQKEDYSSSPYPCNVHANARARHVIAEVNRIGPELVVHLGDIVNPVPELPAYVDAAHNFKTLASILEPPLHLVPGNHDVGDKNVSWAPAGVVNDSHLALYESHFGKHYYAFEHAGVQFVVVNSCIINSGLGVESEQRNWLERQLSQSEGQRCFMFIHHPPYVSRPEEPDSYDNIDEPGRSWLLGLLRRYKPEALFCGHVHNFWYDLYDETDVYVLPSTAFVRQDYSEMFRVGPADQGGRNDTAKLGFFVVDVYAKGHVARNVRTYGAGLEPNEALAANDSAMAPIHSRRNALDAVSMDMRHPWAEELEVAPSGALDEFERKRARNDYPLLALWETGLRNMRVPLQDLLDPSTRERMHKLKSQGHEFQVYCYGTPGDRALEILRRHTHLVDVFELVVDWDAASAQLETVRALKRASEMRAYISRVNRKTSTHHGSGRYNHLIRVGFDLDEEDELKRMVGQHASLIDGIVFRVARETCPSAFAQNAQALVERLDVDASLYIRASADSPAQSFADDVANARRVAQAVVAANQYPRVQVTLDTFADADRGYFCRTGVVDRRYNPRIGSRVLTGLCSLLQTHPAERLTVISSQSGLPVETCRFYDLDSGTEVSADGLDLDAGVTVAVRS